VGEAISYFSHFSARQVSSLAPLRGRSKRAMSFKKPQKAKVLQDHKNPALKAVLADRLDPASFSFEKNYFHT
jgi:hypothetical protein